MKWKILALSVLLAALPFTGCTETEEEPYVEEPSFTATSPCYDYFGHVNAQKLAKFDNYENFTEYVAGELKETYPHSYYIINPGYPQEGWGPYLDEREFFVFVKNEGQPIPFIEEDISLYDAQLGSKKYPPDVAIGGRFSISYSMILYFFEDVDLTELNLEFGFCPSVGSYDKYVNISAGATCIGTMYYRTEVKIPLTWFENYLSKNIIKI